MESMESLVINIAALAVVIPSVCGHVPSLFQKGILTDSDGHVTIWTPFAGFTAGFAALVGCWLILVNKNAPEPYLDEVFHVPQAKRYCEGRYHEWDDKITTPPGLYILAALCCKLAASSFGCSTSTFRALNGVALLQIILLALVCRRKIEARVAAWDRRTEARLSLHALHTAINIGLFPVLFFFSALFYTDVASTLLVLACYSNHLTRISQAGKSLGNDIWTILLGLEALFMRQTNVVWVVVYMGGLEITHTLRAEPSDMEVSGATPLGPFIAKAVSGRFYDVPISMASPADCYLCLASIAIAVPFHLLKLIRQVWSYIIVFILFAGFVWWNGGVVLGDKSNHVVTVHLAQILYLWPLLAFFSAPLLLPSLLSIRHGIHSFRTTDDASSARWLWYSLYLTGTLLFSLAIIRLNTIIHPFTLADNRHYMFYVFRYTIRRPGLMRYYLVAAYTASRWLVWERLGGCSDPNTNAARAIDSPHPALATVDKRKPTEEADTQMSVKPRKRQSRLERTGLITLDDRSCASTTPPLTSTVLLWLLTTVLSLISAPLVEPRYFILPWVFWRLSVPAWEVPGRAEDVAGLGRVAKLGRKVDMTLVLETVWFLAINAATMYIFLFRPFYWRDSEGELLDGGRLQRFMW